MLSLGGIIACMVIAALAGKLTKGNVRLTTYIVIVMLALGQLLIVLYDMYTMQQPEL